MSSELSTNPVTPAEEAATKLLIATFIAWQVAITEIVAFEGGDEATKESVALSTHIVSTAQDNIVKLMAGRSLKLGDKHEVSLSNDVGATLAQIFSNSLAYLPTAIEKELGLDVTTH